MTENLSYERQARRRVVRAQQLITAIEYRLRCMKADLAHGQDCGYRIADDASRLDCAMSELDVLREIRSLFPEGAGHGKPGHMG